MALAQLGLQCALDSKLAEEITTFPSDNAIVKTVLINAHFSQAFPVVVVIWNLLESKFTQTTNPLLCWFHLAKWQCLYVLADWHPAMTLVTYSKWKVLGYSKEPTYITSSLYIWWEAYMIRRAYICILGYSRCCSSAMGTLVSLDSLSPFRLLAYQGRGQRSFTDY